MPYGDRWLIAGYSNSEPEIMFKNYLSTAWRNMVRNKGFSLINIMGLALGLACSILILLWVSDEKKVDGFHENGRFLYQVYERNYLEGTIDASYTTQGLLAEELKKTIPEIQYASGFEYVSPQGDGNAFEHNGKIAKESGAFAGEDFFRMFTYPLIQGNVMTALNEPNSVAISHHMATYFFGSASNAVNKTIRFDDKEDLKVTAVFNEVPSGSSLQFAFLRSWTDFVNQNKWVHNWSNTSPQTFIQLRPEADVVRVQAKIKDFIYNYKQKDRGLVTALALQPFTEKYLHSGFEAGYPDGGRIEYVRLFSIIAAFILLIACINFMNLATARSAKRAKEVGIKKVVGARRSVLIAQFVGEAVLLTFISIVLAIVGILLVLPVFNQLTHKQLFLPVQQPVFWLMMLALLLITGFVAGSYPALFLSSLKPVQVLKGGLKFNWSAAFFRKALVVFQFIMSVLLIVAMIVVYRQLNYIQTKNLGYDRNNLIYIPIEGDLVKHYQVFRQRALADPVIANVSKMRNAPTGISHHFLGISWPGKDPGLTVPFADGVVGYDFVKTMNIRLRSGRDFSREFGTDSVGYLVNETAVNKMGLKDPVGKPISWGGREGKIIGVMNDFHFSSLHETIEPLILRLDENWAWGVIFVRVRPGKTREALILLQQICRQLNPAFPFTYQFSDMEYARLYESESVVSKLANIFAFLAIFISCLGLFGFATFSVEQRSKEIGVRKVLGASVSTIIRLLSAGFLKPVLIAFLIAFPVAWWAMNRWLQHYAYKTGINGWIFIAAGLLITGIALLTVGYQSIKAALVNPVKSLRTE